MSANDCFSNWYSWSCVSNTYTLANATPDGGGAGEAGVHKEMLPVSGVATY